MLQHNTFDTQRLLNICLKKYNLKNHKRGKKNKRKQHEYSYCNEKKSVHGIN